MVEGRYQIQQTEMAKLRLHVESLRKQAESAEIALAKEQENSQVLFDVHDDIATSSWYPLSVRCTFHCAQTRSPTNIDFDRNVYEHEKRRHQLSSFS